MDDDWDRVLIIPFISLSEEGNRYVVFVEAPGLCPSNVQTHLRGRELAISSISFSTRVQVTGTPMQAAALHRIRLPGPVVETGPPAAETVSAGRLRFTMMKADRP